MILGKDYFIVKKSDSKLMIFIGKVFFFSPDFMSGYITTLGRTIYMPNDYWDDGDILHELVHVSDYNKWGLLFNLSYLFALPFLFTLRSYWEKKAYAVTINYIYKKNPEYAKTKEFKEKIISQFIGPAYLYMCPFRKSVEIWFDLTLNKCKEK